MQLYSPNPCPLIMQIFHENFALKVSQKHCFLTWLKITKKNNPMQNWYKNASYLMAFLGENCFLYLSLRFLREIKIMIKMQGKNISTLFSVKLKKFLTKSISQKNSQWNSVKVYFGVEKKDAEVFWPISYNPIHIKLVFTRFVTK